MKKRIILLTAVIIFIAGMTRAQWTTDLGKNTQITPTGLAFDENEVATNKDGVTYVFFITNMNGTLGMRLQIIDKDGNKVMERGGKIISQEANKVWSAYNQHLALDKDGQAFVGVQDFRTAPDSKLNTYTIYKYAPDGRQLWDGTVLNSGKGFATQVGLSMCALDDGGCICTYMYRDDNAQKDCIAIERLDKDGNSIWQKTAVETTYKSTPYPFVTKSDGDNALLTYIYESSSLKTKLIDGNGESLTEEDETVFNGGLASPKPWEVLKIVPGPDNGALITCMDANFNSAFVYVRSNGKTAFDGKPGGIILNDGNYGGAQPAVAYISSDNTFACAYQQFDKNNSNTQGLYMKRYTTDGQALPEGNIEVAAMQNGDMYSFYSVQDAGNGNAALFYQKLDGATKAVNSLLDIYDAGGKKTCGTIQFTETPTKKVNLKSSAMIDGEYFLTSWDEERNGTTSIFMQKVTPETGTGIDAATTDEDGSPVSEEIFSITGSKVSKAGRGVNIIRTTLSNGKTTTRKVVVR